MAVSNNFFDIREEQFNRLRPAKYVNSYLALLQLFVNANNRSGKALKRSGIDTGLVTNANWPVLAASTNHLTDRDEATTLSPRLIFRSAAAERFCTAISKNPALPQIAKA